MQNIVLIGFQGVGKTTHGKRLAREFGMEFVDTDEWIVNKMGGKTTIRDIHVRLGEEKFRALEKEVLLELMEHRNTLIATGGGVVEIAGVKEILSKLGRVVYLYGELSEISKRWKRLGSFLEGKNIEEFFNRRTSLYKRVCDKEIEGTWDQIRLEGSLQ